MIWAQAAFCLYPMIHPYVILISVLIRRICFRDVEPNSCPELSDQQHQLDNHQAMMTFQEACFIKSSFYQALSIEGMNQCSRMCIDTGPHNRCLHMSFFFVLKVSHRFARYADSLYIQAVTQRASSEFSRQEKILMAKIKELECLKSRQNGKHISCAVFSKAASGGLIAQHGNV